MANFTFHTSHFTLAIRVQYSASPWRRRLNTPGHHDVFRGRGLQQVQGELGDGGENPAVKSGERDEADESGVLGVTARGAV